MGSRVRGLNTTSSDVMDYSHTACDGAFCLWRGIIVGWWLRGCRVARGRTRVEGLVLEEGMTAVGKELGIVLGLARECGVASVVDVVWLEDAAVVIRGLSARDDGCVGDRNDEGDEEEKRGEHWMGERDRTETGIL